MEESWCDYSIPQREDEKICKNIGMNTHGKRKKKGEKERERERAREDRGIGFGVTLAIFLLLLTCMNFLNLFEAYSYSVSKEAYY